MAKKVAHYVTRPSNRLGDFAVTIPVAIFFGTVMTTEPPKIAKCYCNHKNSSLLNKSAHGVVPASATRGS